MLGCVIPTLRLKVQHNPPLWDTCEQSQAVQFEVHSLLEGSWHVWLSRPALYFRQQRWSCSSNPEQNKSALKRMTAMSGARHLSRHSHCLHIIIIIITIVAAPSITLQHSCNFMAVFRRCSLLAIYARLSPGSFCALSLLQGRIVSWM